MQIIGAIIPIIPALITAILAIFSTLSSTSQPQRGKPIDLSEYKHLNVKHIQRDALEEPIRQKFKNIILTWFIIYLFLTVIVIIFIIIFIMNTLGIIDIDFLTRALKNVSTHIPLNILSFVYIILSIIGVYFAFMQAKATWRTYKYMKRDAGQAVKDIRHFLFENADITFELDLLIVTKNTLSVLKLMKAEVIELSNSPEKKVLHAYFGSKPPLTKKLTICIEPQGNTCILSST